MAEPESESIFRWETLKEIERSDLNYADPVPGMNCEIELITGEAIEVWRALDRQQYFCHGLTFGGRECPEGPISPWSGRPVATILNALYEFVEPESDARSGDILVWRGIDLGSTPHSAIISQVSVSGEDEFLDDITTMMQTKNGMASEVIVALESLFADYGESYNVYRRCDSSSSKGALS